MKHKRRTHPRKAERMKLNHKDDKALQTFARFCNVDRATLMNETGITANRLRTYTELGIIERVVDPRYDDTFRTTVFGREFINRTYGIECYASNGCYHDRKLYEYYLSLPEEQKASWVSESELREAWKPTQEQSVCDGAYYDDSGTLIVVEAITSNYTQEDIVRHESYATAIGGQYTQI